MHLHARPRGTVRLSQAMAAVAVLVALLTLVGLPGRATHGALTSGDEPYYLLTALSLGQDGDLDLADQIADQAFRPFHEIPLDEQTTPVGPRARRLSPHDPLLPLLLAPAMAAGGWVAAKAVLAILAGLLAAITTWVAVRRVGVGIPVAATTVGLLGAAVPLAPYGTQVYPELPAALLVITVVAVGTGLAATTSRRALGWRLAVVAAMVIALPWLSVKYVPVAATLTAAIGWTTRRTLGWRPILLAGAALAGAGAVYLAAHQVIYGGWTVYAAGDHFVGLGELSVVGTDPDHLGRGRRLAGLLVDRRFGLGAWAPLWLLLPAAVAAAARRLPHRAVVLLPLGVGWLTATFLALTMHGWWVPGRQVVVVLPLAAIAVAALLDHHRRLWAVAIPAGLIGVSSWLWLAVESLTGRRTLIVDFADTAAPGYRLLAPLLPDGIAGDTRADVGLLVWAGLLLATAVWGHRRAVPPATLQPSPARRSGVTVAPGRPWTRAGRRLPGLLPSVAVIGTAIAVVALRDVVDGAALGAGMTAALADVPGLVLALGAFGGAFLLRAAAWCRTLPGLGFGQALAGIHVALGANHLLPLRLGEPLRAVSVVRRAGVGIPEATASTIVLRTADIIALLVLGMAAGPLVLGRLLGLWAAAAAVALAAVAVSGVVVMARQRRRGLAVRLPDVAVVAMTAAAWAMEAVLVWQVARWFGLSLAPGEAMVVLAAAVGAQLLAVTPGGIGTYEAAAAAALAVLGVPVALGITVALSIHGLKTLYSLPAGLVGALLPAPGLVGRIRLPRHGASRPPRRAAAGPVVLFMPALDEAPRVAHVVRRAPTMVRGHQVTVLVVDDGSTDRTAANAREAGAQVVSHPSNLGLGAAVRTGLAWATQVDASAVAFCDADGEYDPAALEDLVVPILDGAADYVVGSRFTGTIRHMRPHRRLGNVVLTAWVRWTVRQPVSDGQSGYRAFSPAAAAAARIPHDYNYAQVLTIDLVAKGFTYREVGIDYAFRASGDSFVRLGRYLRSVVPAVWRQLNATDPLPDRATAPELLLR